MSNLLQILRPMALSGFTPQSGAAGQYILISGANLLDATGLHFLDPFEKKTSTSFSAYYDAASSSYAISGIIPNLHPSRGFYEVMVENEAGSASKCCFYMPMSGGLAEGVKLHSRSFTDRIFLNSVIQPTGTNNTQGFEIKNITFTPSRAESTLKIECELNLYSSSFAGAVVALYKDAETTPRRVWNQLLYDSSVGTVFKFSYITSGAAVAPQTWRVRLGRTPDYIANIHLNRSVTYSTIYGAGAASNINITEFAS
jgi:hypothetical protein